MSHPTQRGSDEDEQRRSRRLTTREETRNPVGEDDPRPYCGHRDVIRMEAEKWVTLHGERGSAYLFS